MGRGLRRRSRLVAILALGIMLGVVITATPASGHITSSVSHVADHMKNYFYTKSQSNARYINVGEIRVDGAHTSAAIDDFTTGCGSPASILSKAFTAPSAGFINVVGSVTSEDDFGIAGSGHLLFRLRLDATPIYGGFAENDYGAFGGGSPEVLGDSGAQNAVVPVTAGAHTVHIEACEAGTGSFITTRGISITFTPAGSGTVIPAATEVADQPLEQPQD
jgi:hypothetical protein